MPVVKLGTSRQVVIPKKLQEELARLGSVPRIPELREVPPVREDGVGGAR